MPVRTCNSSLNVYTTNAKVELAVTERVYNVHRETRTSIYSSHNQLGGITAPELPYGLLRLHIHEGPPSLLKGLMDASKVAPDVAISETKPGMLDHG